MARAGDSSKCCPYRYVHDGRCIGDSDAKSIRISISCREDTF